MNALTQKSFNVTKPIFKCIFNKKNVDSIAINEMFFYKVLSESSQWMTFCWINYSWFYIIFSFFFFYQIVCFYWFDDQKKKNLFFFFLNINLLWIILIWSTITSRNTLLIFLSCFTVAHFFHTFNFAILPTIHFQMFNLWYMRSDSTMHRRTPCA